MDNDINMNVYEVNKGFDEDETNSMIANGKNDVAPPGAGFSNCKRRNSIVKYKEEELAATKMKSMPISEESLLSEIELSDIKARFDAKSKTDETVYTYTPEKAAGKPVEYQANRLQRHVGLNSYTLTNIHHIPVWRRDNDYVYDHYRMTGANMKAVLHSLFYLHNQTFNIYSHGYAGFLFVYLWTTTMFFIFPNHHLEVPEFLAWQVYFFGNAFCFFGSSCFHLTMCHSKGALVKGSRCDYIGIIACKTSNIQLALFYAYFKHNPVYYLFLIVLDTLISAICVYSFTQEWFYKPENRSLRSMLFIGMGVTSIFPLVYYSYCVGLQEANRVISLNKIVIECLYLCGGVVIFALRLPECFFPGFFDIFGHAHNIQHIMTTIGAYYHYVAMIAAFENYHH
eukprot:Awhi_evm1s8592